MNAWCIEGKEPAQGFGLARAVCNMVSMLWESGKAEKLEKKFLPYTQEKMQFRKMVEDADKQGRLAEFVQNGTVVNTSNGGSDGWMM
jgi:hypothetical protein